MVQFHGKKLPARWVYIPTRRQVRDLFRTIPADVRKVEFNGTGSGHGSTGLLLGYIERRVVDGAWRFYLRLWGVPAADLSGRADDLAAAALANIREAVVECLRIPAAETVKPTQVLLRFDVAADAITSHVRVKPVDQFSFSAGAWWADPDPT